MPTGVGRSSEEKLREEKRFLEAAKTGDIGFVRKCLREFTRGIDVNCSDADGYTALHKAAENGHYKITKCLLEYGADVHITSNIGSAPLHSVAGSGYNNGVADLLLTSGADVNAKTNIVGKSALHYAVEKGHHNMAKVLLETGGADVNLQSTITGSTPLHRILKKWNYASEDPMACVHLLLSYDADPSIPDNEGQTAIAIAQKENSDCSEALPLLLKASSLESSSNKTTATGLRSTAQAAMNQSDNRVPSVLEKKMSADQEELFRKAARNGDIVSVQKYIRDGVNVRCQDSFFCVTALHEAASGGHHAIAELLLESGADIEPKNRYGYTPLHIAVQSGHHDIVKLLLEKGADANCRYTDGWTPLHSVTCRRVAKLLLDFNADVNAKSHRGYTPLHRILGYWSNAHDEHLAILNLLLEYGADPTIPNSEGETALGIAKKDKKYSDAIPALLQAAREFGRARALGTDPPTQQSSSVFSAWGPVLKQAARKFGETTESRSGTSAPALAADPPTQQSASVFHAWGLGRKQAADGERAVDIAKNDTKYNDAILTLQQAARRFIGTTESRSSASTRALAADAPVVARSSRSTPHSTQHSASVFHASAPERIVARRIVPGSSEMVGSLGTGSSNDIWDTMWLTVSGTEEPVGKLALSEIRHPEEEWPMSTEPYVFISHTGHDGVKEEIARPTYWFLKNVLGVEAFVDALSMEAGRQKVQALLPPAYSCTHALTILSPTYRKRAFCVKELNLFMDRLKRNDGIHVLPALWLMDSVEGYHDAVKDLIWIRHETKYAINYMTQTLWPNLCTVLGRDRTSVRESEEHLSNYIENQLGGPLNIPSDFVKFAKDRGVPSLTLIRDDSSLSSTSSSDSLRVGLMFSRIFMDDEIVWNNKILERKRHIEKNLEYIKCHGTVVYGTTEMEEDRLGFLGLGRSVARLECEIELREDLTYDSYLQVKSSAKCIADLLRDAGTTETQLERLMIGPAWKGSLQMVIEAQTILFEKLYGLLVDAKFRLPLNNGMALVDLTPAYVFRGTFQNQFPARGKKTSVVLWKTDELGLLEPTSYLARGKLLAGGIQCIELDGPDEKVRDRFLSVSVQDLSVRDLEGGGTAKDSSIPSTLAKSQDDPSRYDDAIPIITATLVNPDEALLPHGDLKGIYRDAILSEEDEDTLELHAAVKFGNKEVLEELLQDPDVARVINAKDSQNRTAADLAALTGQTELMDLLLNQGGKFSKKSRARMKAMAEKRTLGVQDYLRLVHSEL